MSWHGIQELIKYRWKALGRHGVHSPFMYAMVDEILPGCRKATISPDISRCTWLPPKYQALVAGLAAHFKATALKIVDNEFEEPLGLYDVLLIKNTIPGQWIRLFNRYANHLKPSGMVIVAGIHQTARHSAKWKRLCSHPGVMLSADLYGVGVIFFGKDFKEKQHFVLKY